MKIKPEQLASKLSQQPAPVYLITGDETLLIEESCDLLRQHLHQIGFSERETLHVESGFKWEYLLECANALSLFAEQKIIELRLGKQKLNKPASEILRHYLQQPPEDNVLLIIADKLDASAKKSAWFKAIDQQGIIVEVWPIELQQLPHWINQRAQQIGLTLENDASQLLCERIEGNLLAAKQELDKLNLLYAGQNVTVDMVMDSVSDSSRYDIYGLTEAAILQQVPRCTKIIDVLRQEGTEASVALWAIARDIRALIMIKNGLQKGTPFDTLCQRERIWGPRKNQMRNAVQRLSSTQLSQMLSRCSEADAQIKGEPGDAWLTLTGIILQLAGIELLLTV